MPPKRICFLSSVHYALDGRIVQKEARSLAAAGFEVRVIARADSTGEPPAGVEVIPLEKTSKRLGRIVKVARLAFAQQADIYTVHDPELILLAMALKLGKGRKVKVVYDVHEDVPQQILDKTWLPKPLRPLTRLAYKLIEGLALNLLDGLVLAEDSYQKYYRRRNNKVVLNYPLLDLTQAPTSAAPAAAPRPTLVYAGTLAKIRGLYDMLALVSRLRQIHPRILLRLVGPINIPAEAERTQELIASLEIEDHVELTGRVSLAEVYRHVAAADVGLALLHPEPNYVASLPTKIFEYMLMAKPVVVSHFPLWRQIVERADCGFAVDPYDPEAVIKAVNGLLDNPDESRQRGQRGRDAVLQEYNWQSQVDGLVQFYRALAPSADSAKTD